MDPEPGEYRDFPAPDILVNDDVAHPFSSPIHAETVNRPLNDLPSAFDSSWYPNITVDNSQSIESGVDMTKNISSENIKTELIENNKEVQVHNFDNDKKQEKILIDQQNFFVEELLQLVSNTKRFAIHELNFLIKNLNEKFNYLEKECERIQRITTHFENQLIAVKSIGKKISLFSIACRSIIISALNIRQNTDHLSSREFEMLTSYAPDSASITSNIANVLLDQQSLIDNENPVDDYKHRLEYARLTLNLLKQANKLRLQISTLNDVLIKSVLSKNERFTEIEQSLRLPSNFFDNNPLYETFPFEITTNKQDVYIRCIRGQLTENDFHVICTENPKHSLLQINYNACEKYSHIFDIECKRAITSIDQLTIALPCFPLPSELQSTNSSHRSESPRQQIYIRCKRIIDPIIHIPAAIEIYNDISYAVFRMTQSLSAISVEAVLFYPFEVLQASHDVIDSYSVYTSEHSSIFRIETPKNYFIRSPRVRIIPFNSELIRCMTVQQSEDQLLAASDLIEFEWFKETKVEGIVSITIPLTRHFNLFNEANDDQQKRRRKAQKKISLQRKKFEQEKYDEIGGSLAATPTSSHGLTSPTIISHLPSIAAIIERAVTDRQERLVTPRFNINHGNHRNS